FDADFFAQPRDPASEDPRPVFIVGMPRSGTTLTEQIISMHSQAGGCGELPDIALIAKSLGGRWPLQAASLDPALLNRAGARYLEAALRRAPDGALRLVDKSPLNYFNLGLVGLLF